MNLIEEFSESLLHAEHTLHPELVCTLPKNASRTHRCVGVQQCSHSTLLYTTMCPRHNCTNTIAQTQLHNCTIAPPELELLTMGALSKKLRPGRMSARECISTATTCSLALHASGMHNWTTAPLQRELLTMVYTLSKMHPGRIGARESSSAACFYYNVSKTQLNHCTARTRVAHHGVHSLKKNASRTHQCAGEHQHSHNMLSRAAMRPGRTIAPPHHSTRVAHHGVHCLKKMRPGRISARESSSTATASSRAAMHPGCTIALQWNLP